MKQCKAKVIRLTMTLFLAVCLMLNVVGPQIMAYQGEPAIAWKAPDEIVIDGKVWTGTELLLLLLHSWNKYLEMPINGLARPT